MASDESDLRKLYPYPARYCSRFCNYRRMTMLQRLACALIVLFLSGCWGFQAQTQNKARLPAELNQNSSVLEIVSWLDRTSFRHARIALKDSWDDEHDEPPWSDLQPAEQTFVFNPGFRFTNLESCTIALENDDATMVDRPATADQKNRLKAHLNIQLSRAGATKGRSTFRYTKDPEKARLFGTWRSEYRYHGWSSRTIHGLRLYSGDSQKPAGVWIGTNVAFIFDSKEMSEQFDAAFRRAIRLCRPK